MLEFAKSYDGPPLAILVNHDDAQREYSYESVAGTFETDETILERIPNRSGEFRASALLPRRACVHLPRG